jgi:putative ABC transport system ATP-binding protein
MSDTIVELVDVKKYYHRGNETVRAIDGIDLSIRKKDFISIVGPSGSGKTTLLNLMGCMDNPSNGTIKINNENVSNFKQEELTKIRRNVVGFVFQQFFLIPTLTVSENIQIPGLFANNPDRIKKAEELLDMVGLTDRINHLPSELSGGEMQRVAIARSLINSPQLVLADEPTGNLDTENSRTILNTFQDLNKKGITIIMVTHNLDLAKSCKKIIKLENGKIINE